MRLPHLYISEAAPSVLVLALLHGAGHPARGALAAAPLLACLRAAHYPPWALSTALFLLLPLLHQPFFPLRLLCRLLCQHAECTLVISRLLPHSSHVPRGVQGLAHNA